MEYTVTIFGRGAHGSRPDLGRNPVDCFAAAYGALQTIGCTISDVDGGTAGNIIPETVEMRGTIRTLGPEMRANMCKWFTELVEGTAKAMGAEAIVDLKESHPGIVNEEGMCDLVYASMEKLVGKENIRLARIPNMGTEDFGAFMKRDLSVPGCFCSFGFGGENCDKPAHSPFHRINEEGMAYAAALFAQVSLDFLREE